GRRARRHRPHDAALGRRRLLRPPPGGGAMPAYRRLKLDAALWDTLKAVHGAVLGRFIWVADEHNFGRPEHWDRPVPGRGGTIKGDCDDFAIECDFEARARGIPPDAMTYYRCTTETGA